MSSSDVLRRFVKRDVTSYDSRSTLDEFLRSPCYNYFLRTLQGPDIIRYADFLDKVSTRAVRGAQGFHRLLGIGLNSSDGEALENLFGCPSTDMWGPSHTPLNTRFVSWNDQKRKCFHNDP